MISMDIVAKHLHDSCDEKQTILVTLPEINILKILNQKEEINIDTY